MNGTIPTLSEFARLVSEISPVVPVAIFFITAGALILFRDWRISISALLTQYLAMGVMLAQIVRPEIAFAEVLVGTFICLMLYLSARQAGWRYKLTFFSHGLRALLGTRTIGKEMLPPGRAFRLMAILLMAVTAVALAQSYPIYNLEFAPSIAVYWLCLAGLLLLLFTEDPLKTGLGLLTMITGFELWYTTLEQSLLMVGLWGIICLLLALITGYLSAVRGVVLEEDF